MKKIILFTLTLFFTLIFTFPEMDMQNAHARRKYKKPTVVALKDLEDIYYISQDLNEETAIFIDPMNDCFCSCRGNMWSCTQLECKIHMKECENEILEE